MSKVQRNPQTYLKFGTTSGASITVPATSGRSTYIESIHGANDLNHCTVEITSPLTGKLSTTTGDATVTGTGTDFINELYVGACVKVGDTSEILYVSSITDATHFEATANSGSNETSSDAVLFMASIEYGRGNIDDHFNGGFRGIRGKSVIVNMTDSTSACSLMVSSYTS
jgi:hypothetical protein